MRRGCLVQKCLRNVLIKLEQQRWIVWSINAKPNNLRSYGLTAVAIIIGKMDVKIMSLGLNYAYNGLWK